MLRINRRLQKERRKYVKEIFAKHRGAQTVVAKRLGVNPASVSAWVRGELNTLRLEVACLSYAFELARADGAVYARRALTQLKKSDGRKRD